MRKLIKRLGSLSKRQTTLHIYKIIGSLVAIQLCLGSASPYDIIGRHGYAIPHIVGVVTLIIYLDDIIRILDHIWSQIPHTFVAKTVQTGVGDVMVDNVPVHILIAFLIKNNGRPVIAAKEELGLTTAEHKKLGDNLERVGILRRGENNARVLASVSEDTLVDILLQSGDSDKLHPAIIQDKENPMHYSLSTTVSANHTENRIYS